MGTDNSILTVYYDNKENKIVVAFSEKALKEKYDRGFVYDCRISPLNIYMQLGLSFGSECIPISGSIGPDHILSKFSANSIDIHKLFDSLIKIIPSIKREDLESLLNS